MATKKTSVERNIALCYIRQSQTRNEMDTNSPERQRANIQEVCDKQGWIPEWYQDAEGHKSGRQVKNRPGWLALEKRLGDPDVVALVANDLSRLHRKGWRVGDLIERLEEYRIELVTCAAGSQTVDTTAPGGRIFIQFKAVYDEYYAEDISQKAKDSVAYRKKRGISIGKPPFGTIRNRNGYLIPDPNGVWLLANGNYMVGLANTVPDNAVSWFGYYNAVGRIFTLFTEQNIGTERLTYLMDKEGWLFCDRKGKPRPMTADDIRRILSSWAAYGGIITHRRSKDYAAYEILEVDEIPFDGERTVFPIGLLREVARKRKERSKRPVDHGRKQEVKFYALSGIVYCVHCERLAEREQNPKLRSLLTGSKARSVARYRHKLGVSCGCQARSVICEVLEGEFMRLIQLLAVKPEMIAIMSKLALSADKNLLEAHNLEEEKQTQIALYRKKLAASKQLYKDAEIEYEEYQSDKQHYERQITHWEGVTTDSQQITFELTMCMDALDKMAQLWTMASDEDRQGMAQNFFTSITYDLDTQRIEAFELKPWADRFLMLRAALYDEDEGNKNAANHQGLQRDMPHTGVKPISRLQIASAVFDLLDDFFGALSVRKTSKTALAARNGQMVGRFVAGETIEELAKVFGLTYQRVHQIVRS